MRTKKPILITACAGALLLGQFQASADEAAAVPAVDFRFPRPVMIQADGSETPVEPPPMSMQAPPPEPFDSDKQREADLARERQEEQARAEGSVQGAPADPTSGFAVAPLTSSFNPEPPSQPIESVVSQASAQSDDGGSSNESSGGPGLWVPKITFSPAKHGMDRIESDQASGSRSYWIRPGKEPNCEDASVKAVVQTLVDRDKKLLIKQARHTEAIRRLRDADGKHPHPELIAKIAPYEAAFRARISKGLPKHSFEKRRASLDQAIYSGRSEELLSRMQASAREAKPRAKAAIDKHPRDRKSIDRSKFSEAALKYLGSYQAERLEVERWIRSFESVCKQMAYLKRAGNRGMASVPAAKVARTASLR